MRVHMYKFPSDWRHIHLPPDTEVKAITLLICWHMCTHTISLNPTTHAPACYDTILSVCSDVRLLICPHSSLNMMKRKHQEKGGGGGKKEETWCRVWGQLKGWVTRLMSRQVAPLQKQPHTHSLTHSHTHKTYPLAGITVCKCVCVC